MRSCSWPISSARVGWYPTAGGLRPSSVETAEPGWVDRPALGHLELLALLEVEHLAEGVEDVPLGDVADGDRDGRARVGDLGAADEPVGGLHGDRAHHAVAEVLGDLEGQRLLDALQR